MGNVGFVLFFILNIGKGCWAFGWDWRKDDFSVVYIFFIIFLLLSGTLFFFLFRLVLYLWENFVY